MFRRLSFPLLLALLLAPAAALASGESHGFQPKVFILFVVDFVVLAGLLVWLARDKVRAFFASRRETVVRELEEAEAIRAEAIALLERTQTQMAHLAEEVQRIRSQFEADGEKEKRRMIAEAREEADRIRREAELRISQESKKARERLRDDATRLALQLAEKVIRERLDEEARERLFTDAVGQLKKIRPEQLISS